MNNPFKLLRSHKLGLEGSENYVVARDNVVYLRIVGGGPRWDVMTATADEDQGGITACPNQLRLREAAKRIGTELKTKPCERLDWLAREYVVICGYLIDRPDEPLANQAGLLDFCTRFFETYDDLQTAPEDARNEMRDLYRALAGGCDGGAVYLSDGVWLSSDGLMQDRGR